MLLSGLRGEAQLQDLQLDPTEEVKKEDMLEFTPSEFSERLIYVDGKPFNSDGGFKTRPYLTPIYNGNHRRLLLKCARQVEKSTTLGNRLLTLSILRPFFRSLYIAPTAPQSSRFSADRLNRPLMTSPGLLQIKASMPVDNILLKEFPNHSTITLGSVYYEADRMRGIPADLVNIDEFQDIISKNIPVIEESLSHSRPEYRYFWGAGTPKSLDNPIEIYWDRFSTQNEWTVPCERHSPVHWNILTIRSIGTEGIICDQCGQRIFAAQGKWQITGDPQAKFHGYRISQLMVPWMPWEEILDRLKRYPTDLFYNEVLGISYDSGRRPLTRQQIIRCCKPDLGMSLHDLQNFCRTYKSSPLFMGVDWGTGEVSFTTIIIMAYHPKYQNALTIIFAKKFIGEEAEPTKQLQHIFNLIGNHNIRMTGTDWGFGHYENDALLRKFGRSRVVPYMYSSEARRKVRWDADLRRYMVNRTAIMSDIFNAIKRKVFAFPRESEFMDYVGSDYLNIFAEYSPRSRQTLYNHPPDRPDDAFHATIYATLASMLIRPRPDILDPAQLQQG
jgi:hypothetical protein